MPDPINRRPFNPQLLQSIQNLTNVKLTKSSAPQKERLSLADWEAKQHPDIDRNNLPDDVTWVESSKNYYVKDEFSDDDTGMTEISEAIVRHLILTKQTYDPECNYAHILKAPYENNSKVGNEVETVRAFLENLIGRPNEKPKGPVAPKSGASTQPLHSKTIKSAPQGNLHVPMKTPSRKGTIQTPPKVQEQDKPLVQYHSTLARQVPPGTYEKIKGEVIFNSYGLSKEKREELLNNAHRLAVAKELKVREIHENDFNREQEVLKNIIKSTTPEQRKKRETALTQLLLKNRPMPKENPKSSGLEKQLNTSVLNPQPHHQNTSTTIIHNSPPPIPNLHGDSKSHDDGENPSVTENQPLKIVEKSSPCKSTESKVKTLTDEIEEKSETLEEVESLVSKLQTNIIHDPTSQPYTDEFRQTREREVALALQQYEMIAGGDGPLLSNTLHEHITPDTQSPQIESEKAKKNPHIDRLVNTVELLNIDRTTKTYTNFVQHNDRLALDVDSLVSNIVKDFDHEDEEARELARDILFTLNLHEDPSVRNAAERYLPSMYAIDPEGIEEVSVRTVQELSHLANSSERISPLVAVIAYDAFKDQNDDDQEEKILCERVMEKSGIKPRPDDEFIGSLENLVSLERTISESELLPRDLGNGIYFAGVISELEDTPRRSELIHEHLQKVDAGQHVTTLISVYDKATKDYATLVLHNHSRCWIAYENTNLPEDFNLDSNCRNKIYRKAHRLPAKDGGLIPFQFAEYLKRLKEEKVEVKSASYLADKFEPRDPVLTEQSALRWRLRLLQQYGEQNIKTSQVVDS